MPRAHGIEMVNGSVISNFRLQSLSTDPTELSYGMMWYNSTDNKVKYTTFDDLNNVIIKALGSSNILYGTSVIPPSATGLEDGTIYIQYGE